MDQQTISNVPTGMSDEEAISRFADRLIEERGLDGLGEEEKNKLKDEIVDKFIDRVNKALIFALPEDKFRELKEFLKQEPAQDEANMRISEIVESAGIDMKKIVTETAKDFRQAFLEDKEGEE